jgi:hypothetical protein
MKMTKEHHATVVLIIQLNEIVIVSVKALFSEESIDLVNGFIRKNQI